MIVRIGNRPFVLQLLYELVVALRLPRRSTVLFGLGVITLVVLAAFAAPFLTDVDPTTLNPRHRLAPPSWDARLFGADALGRDVYSRTLYGGRASLMIGLSVATLATVIGLLFGLVAGYFRAVDAIVMRVMDGLMAIPGILVAIALVTLFRANVLNVIIAITIPEIPRVVRLVRASVLSLREQPYVEAAVSLGSSHLQILHRHILPNVVAPLTVQSTYVCASAIIVEAYLSFLGAGTPIEVPSWGNIMAEGRMYFTVAPWIILLPGMFLACTVLSVNLLGDALRDQLDPHARQPQ